MRFLATRWVNTAEEMAARIAASPSFKHVDIAVLLRQVEIDSNYSDLPEMQPWLPNAEIFCVEHEGRHWDARACVEEAKYIRFYEPGLFANYVIKNFGCTCLVCKALINDSYKNIIKLMGCWCANSLIDEHFYSTTGFGAQIPPLCIVCAKEAGDRIWKGKNSILGAIQRPNLEEEELAVLQWLSEKVRKETRTALKAAKIEKRVVVDTQALSVQKTIEYFRDRA